MENENNVINNENTTEVVEEINEVVAETEAPIISDDAAESEPIGEPVAFAPEAYYSAYADNNKKSGKTGLVIGIACAVLAIIMAVVAVYLFLFSPMAKYNRAGNLLSQGRYDEAISIYEGISDYKDSEDQIDLCNYEKALSLIDDGEYDEAVEIFEDLEDYEDSALRITECNKRAVLEYCEENGSVSIYSSDDTYKLSAENGNLVISQIMRADSVTSTTKFILSMDSDEGTFDVTIGSYISGTGTFKASEISLLDAPVTGESGSIYITDSQIEEYVSLALRVTCYEINPLLTKTGLDLTAADIGFTKIN